MCNPTQQMFAARESQLAMIASFPYGSAPSFVDVHAHTHSTQNKPLAHNTQPYLIHTLQGRWGTPGSGLTDQHVYDPSLLRTWRELEPRWRTALGAFERGYTELFDYGTRQCKESLVKMLRDGIGDRFDHDDGLAGTIAYTLLFPEFIHMFSLPGGICNDNAQAYHCRTWQYAALIELGVRPVGVRDWLLRNPLSDNPDKKRLDYLAACVAHHYNPDVVPPAHTGPRLRSQAAPPPEPPEFKGATFELGEEPFSKAKFEALMGEKVDYRKWQLFVEVVNERRDNLDGFADLFTLWGTYGDEDPWWGR